MRPLLLASLLLGLVVGTPMPAAHAATYGADARLLVDRDEGWQAIVDMVSHAKRSVAIDYYVLGGPRAMELAELLGRRQREGVAVRVLLDPDMGILPALKSLTTPVLARLQAEHVPVRFFPRDALGRLHHYRLVEDHTKVVVADGQTAFVGSMNFGAELLHNHDIGVRVEGEVAHAVMDDILSAFALAEPLGPENPRPWPAAGIAWQPATSEVRYLPTGLFGTPARAALLRAIATARRSIRVMMFEFEDTGVADALVDAARRGVDVRVLMDPNDLDHLSPVGWAPRGVFNLRVAARLAMAQVPVRWYRPDPQHRQLHAKAALIDNTLFAGSTNWNHFSFYWNNETMLQIKGGQAPARFADQFDNDWVSHTDAVADEPSVPRLWAYRALAYMLN